MEFITKSTFETKSLGKEVASDLMANGQGLMVNVLALTGDLGSGKTTFVQGFAEGLGVKARIISPTFILMRHYKVSINHQSLTISHFYHIDLYRLEGNIGNEVINLGLGDIWEKPENIVVIEWAEKIKEMIPESARWIKFENLGGDRRKITIND